MDSKGSINPLTILEWRNGVVKEWVMDSEVEEPSIGGACSAMIHRFKCIPGWVRLVEAGIGSAGHTHVVEESL